MFGHTGAVVAALSASWPSFRFPGEAIGKATRAVRAAADQVSSILGHPGLAREME